jgi:allantoin racemase
MKLLLVNPNLSQAVTDKVVAEARRAARTGTEFTGVTGTFGVAIVSTEAEVAIAAHATLDLIATHQEGHDGAIVAMSFDAGALAARRLFPFPVLGITEAAIHTACLVGRRFGMVVSGAVSVPLYLDLLAATGVRDRMTAMEVVDLSTVAAYLDTGMVEARLLEAAQRLSLRPEIEAIILCGAAVAGIARCLQPRLSVPLIDGVAAATGQIETLAHLQIRPKTRPAALSAGLPTVGLGASLGRTLAADA